MFSETSVSVALGTDPVTGEIVREALNTFSQPIQLSAKLVPTVAGKSARRIPYGCILGFLGLRN
jgi:hypothetical protein